MKTALIIAANTDIHADAVLLELRKRGISSLRFDPEEDWCPDYNISFRQDNINGSATIKSPLCNLDIERLGAVFCRNWNFYKPPESSSHEEHLRAHEMRSAITGFLKAHKDLFWINQPWMEDFYDSKIVQSRSAFDFGIPIPDTIVTNKLQAALDFHAYCDNKVIIKQLSEVGLTYINHSNNGIDAYGFYTEPVYMAQLLEHKEQVGNSPILLQRFIEKTADIRVNVVGKKLFAYRIFSQDQETSKVDFRKHVNHRIEPCEFPQQLGNQLIRMIQSWGIHFACCDFAETADGKHYFLEANVTGNWLWLENNRIHPILDAVVADIEDNCCK